MGNQLSSIVDRAEKFADCGMVEGKAWSLAHICEHLALSIENTVRGSSADGLPRLWQRMSRSQRFARWFLKRLMLLVGHFPKGVPAPESVQPVEDVSLDASLERLRAAAAAFEQKYAGRNASWGYHSLLGRMSGRAWRRFHGVHAAHHFSFLKPFRAR